MRNSQLPLRPEPHVTGERAVLAFRESLPPKWIFRELNSDYGIDCEIEIVAPCGSVLGAVVKAQVKGTSPFLYHRRRGVSVSAGTVRYWIALPVPVILVSVSLNPTRVKWIDVREYLLDKDRLEGLYSSTQANYYFEFRKAHHLPEDTSILETIALEHQHRVNAMREEDALDVKAQFIGYVIMVKLFGGSPDKWIAWLREKGGKDQLLRDLPFAYWVKEEAEKDPSLLERVRKMVEETTQPAHGADGQTPAAHA